MKDETYAFISDVKEKKITARSARHTRTHCGKGGRVRLPSDNLSKKELQKMNGECKAYRLNDPMAWKEFKSMPDDLKITYIKLLRQKFNVPDSQIGKQKMANEKRLIAFDPITFESFTRHATKHREPYDHYDMGYVDAVDQIDDWMDANTVQAYTSHDVAVIIADLFGDACACNFNGIDEWLPEHCELLDACPNVVGVACWEQYLKFRGAKMDGDGNV